MSIVTELHGAAVEKTAPSAHSELDAILNLEVTIAFGQRAADNAVRNETLTLRRLITDRLTPREGPKDGPCILQGSSVSSQRKSGNMREQHLLMFDVENGDSESEVADRITSAGFLAAIYTTHSHMKEETRISERDFASQRQPGRSDVDMAREFLRTRKQYRPWLLDTIVRVKRRRVDGGAEYVVVHAPMPRLRVVLFLEKPFPFFVEGKTIAERIAEWKARYLAGAAAVGLVVDQSCTDPARLMYLPSHAPGTPKPKTRFIEGRLLHLDALEVSPDDVTAKGTAGAVHPTQFTPATTGLKKFLARYDKVFDAVAFFAEREEPRHAYEDGRAEFGCPNEQSHTNPDPTDRAFVVQPAKDGRGFNLFCHHNGCQYAPQKCDRAQLLDFECVERGIKHAQELLKWCPGHEADALEARDTDKGEESDAASDNWTPFSTSMADTINDPIQDEPFVVEKWMPRGYAALFSGDAALGKTTTLVHAAVCVAAGKPFFGFKVEQGEVLGMMAENTENQLRRMVRASCEHLGVNVEDVSKRLLLESYVVREAALWEDKPGGKAGPTPLGYQLEQRLAVGPAIKLVLLDSTVDVYRGSEFDRQAVSQFMIWLTALGAKYQVAFVLIHHESKSAGENDSHAASGSTAWRYKCKSQGRFQKVKEIDDKSTLKHTKHSFSSAAPQLTLQYRGGIYVALNEDTRREAACIEVARQLMTAAIKAGVNLSPHSKANNYGPRYLQKNQGGGDYSVPEFERAIDALLVFTITIATYKVRRREHRRYVLQAAANDEE